MSEENIEQTQPQIPPRRHGYRLLRKVILYHLVVGILVLGFVTVFPEVVHVLPIGGVESLAENHAVDLVDVPSVSDLDANEPIVRTVIRASAELDRLGYARQLIITLAGVWLLMLPVSWVHKGIHKSVHHVSSYDHSLDETTLVLPGIVAAIVLVVQHSLALAFSLAGIVAGVQFRRALQDTYDALFILVAIGTGISAGVQALEIAAVLTVFFSYASLYVYYFGDGLESDYAAFRKAEKHRLKLKALGKSKKSNGPDDQDKGSSA
jgi:hypothetical protein